MSATAKKIMKYTRKAIIDYQMIDNADGIMVGLSGGKDSLTLLAMLKEFLISSKYKFPLAAGHIGLGFPTETEKLEQFCQQLDIPFYQEETNISEIVFDIRQESNPCSLCAKMRRGALNSLAKKHGYPKVALGHHLDDVLETLLLNMCFEGRVDSFKPVTFLSKQEITVIRPLIYVQERTIATYTRQEQLPVIQSCCPANGNTKREEMKQIIQELMVVSPHAKERMLRALQHVEGNEWQTQKRKK